MEKPWKDEELADSYLARMHEIILAECGPDFFRQKGEYEPDALVIRGEDEDGRHTITTLGFAAYVEQTEGRFSVNYCLYKYVYTEYSADDAIPHDVITELMQKGFEPTPNSELMVVERHVFTCDNKDLAVVHDHDIEYQVLDEDEEPIYSVYLDLSDSKVGPEDSRLNPGRMKVANAVIAEYEIENSRLEIDVLLATIGHRALDYVTTNADTGI
jgi:hypothetical protein